MKYKLFLLCFCLLYTSSRLYAQEKKRHVFFETNLGLIIADGDLHTNATLGAGYAIKSGYELRNVHGFGIEYKGNTLMSISNNFSMSGIGFLYRFTQYGIYTKFSTGFVLDGRRGWDHEDQFEYKNGGHFVSFNVGYLFKGGFLLGLNYTNILNMQFDYFKYDHSNDSHNFDRIEDIGFSSFTIMLGYTWPGR